MSLPGCADRIASTPRPPVVVKLTDRPPAELLVCADRPAALPVDELAIITPRLRSAIIGMARAFGVNADRLDRLTNWVSPAACKDAAR